MSDPSARRSFISAINSAEDVPLEFDIGSEDEATGARVVQTFRFCPWLVPGAVALDLDSSVPINEDERSPMWRLFRLGLGEDYPAFRAFVVDPKTRVGANDLGELSVWMREEVVGVPIQRPSPS